MALSPFGGGGGMFGMPNFGAVMPQQFGGYPQQQAYPAYAAESAMPYYGNTGIAGGLGGMGSMGQPYGSMMKSSMSMPSYGGMPFGNYNTGINGGGMPFGMKNMMQMNYGGMGGMGGMFGLNPYALMSMFQPQAFSRPQSFNSLPGKVDMAQGQPSGTPSGGAGLPSNGIVPPSNPVLQQAPPLDRRAMARFGIAMPQVFTPPNPGGPTPGNPPPTQPPPPTTPPPTIPPTTPPPTTPPGTPPTTPPPTTPPTQPPPSGPPAGANPPEYMQPGQYGWARSGMFGTPGSALALMSPGVENWMRQMMTGPGANTGWRTGFSLDPNNIIGSIENASGQRYDPSVYGSFMTPTYGRWM